MAKKNSGGEANSATANLGFEARLWLTAGQAVPAPHFEEAGFYGGRAQAPIECDDPRLKGVITIEPDDFDYVPFSQKGDLGEAHQLFGDALPALVDEVNTTLAS